MPSSKLKYLMVIFLSRKDGKELQKEDRNNCIGRRDYRVYSQYYSPENFSIRKVTEKNYLREFTLQHRIKNIPKRRKTESKRAPKYTTSQGFTKEQENNLNE